MTTEKRTALKSSKESSSLLPANKKRRKKSKSCCSGSKLSKSSSSVTIIKSKPELFEYEDEEEADFIVLINGGAKVCAKVFECIATTTPRRYKSGTVKKSFTLK